MAWSLALTDWLPHRHLLLTWRPRPRFIHRTLLAFGQGANNPCVFAVALAFDVVDLDFLLREHAATHEYDQAVHQAFNTIGDFRDALRHSYDARRQTRRPQDTVVARRVFSVEARLHEITVRRDGQAFATAPFYVRTILILWRKWTTTSVGTTVILLVD